MARKFLYYLKLHNSELLHAEGHNVTEACQAAGVKLSEVKRHMPVKALLSEEELAARAKRFDLLRQRKQKETDEAEQSKDDVIDTLET